jgi:hypothetical protein
MPHASTVTDSAGAATRDPNAGRQGPRRATGETDPRDSHPWEGCFDAPIGHDGGRCRRRGGSGRVDGVVTLVVGDVYQLRRGKDRIIYAGMPTADVYSIVELKWEFFYRGYAWNLFFPTEQKRIRIDGVNLLVEQVSAHDITLRG